MYFHSWFQDTYYNYLSYQINVLYCINILLICSGILYHRAEALSMMLIPIIIKKQEDHFSSEYYYGGCSKNLGTISYHPLLFANVFDRNWPKNYRAWNWPQIFTFLSPLSLGCSIERWFIIEVWRRICFIKVVATGNTVAIAAIVYWHLHQLMCIKRWTTSRILLRDLFEKKKSELHFLMHFN